MTEKRCGQPRSGRWPDDPLALPIVRGDRVRLEALAGSPDQDDHPAVERWVRSSGRPTAVDLFSGAGGLSLGLEQAGFRVVAAADEDEVALETHRANLGGLTYTGDLSDPEDFLAFLSERGIRSVSLVAGGPPCQPFSRAGRSKIKSLVQQGKRPQADGRASLWRSFCAVVKALKPDAVVFENVPDLIRWNDGEVLLEVLTSLRELGYRSHARVLLASEYGVPQERARLFIVGVQGREFRWPRRSAVVTLGDAISDLPPIRAGQRERVLDYDGPATRFQRRARRRVLGEHASVVFDHIVRNVRDDDAEAFELLRPGQTYRDLPEHLRRYRADTFTDKYKRLDYDQLCRAITAHIAKDGYWYIHPSQTRTLSLREAARIQTFPDRFRFAGHATSQFRQIGNAVPPALGRAVGRRVLAAVDGPYQEENEASPSLAQDLLGWWNANQRSFPWRKTRDPWSVLLAELCLRRTRADQVSERFGRILDAAPTARAAAKDTQNLSLALNGLGLARRSRDIVRIAQIIDERYDGCVPEDEASLRELPGVGHYIAGAVRCFAFGKPAVLLDTNTSRIASRLAGRSLSARETRLEIFQHSGSEGPSSRFSLALLDLGGLVCVARKPVCEVCPLAPHCATGRRQSRRGNRRNAEPERTLR